MTKILVVDDEANIQRVLQYSLKQAGYEVLVAQDGRAALKLWETEEPALILLDVSLPKLDGYQVAARIRESEGGAAHVPIIMLTAEKDVEQKVRGLRAGADDYLVKPFHQAELLARMRGLLARFAAKEVGGLARPPQGRMLAFYGAKGGVGSTTVAINSAIALHTEHDRKVVLVDAVLQFGDHRVFLDLDVDRKSISDAIAAPTVDADLLKSVVVTHDSGIDLLLAPARPEEADMVNTERLGNVLRILREMYDYVIVDVDRPLNDLTLSVLDLADELIVVMTADLASLKNVRLVMETLHRIGFGTDRLRLVLNRSNAFTGVSIEAAEGALKRRFDQRITNEYRYAIAAENTGQPVSFSKPDSPLARQIAELARSIVGETNIAEAPAAVAGRRRGVMSRG